MKDSCLNLAEVFSHREAAGSTPLSDVTGRYRAMNIIRIALLSFLVVAPWHCPDSLARAPSVGAVVAG